MEDMFYYCSSLNELNISNFNINKETYTDRMFSGFSEKLKKKIKREFNNLYYGSYTLDD